MDFEHLIQINDPLNPLLTPVTRNQLWRGLVERAEDPVPFTEGLDACRHVNRDGQILERELCFGSTLIRDRVVFVVAEAIHFLVEESDSFAASSLEIRIEEPAAEQLYLRFTYQSAQQKTPEAGQEEVEEFVRQAYYKADLDTVSRIRKLAEQGLLG